jgi:hypothetical protein
LPGAGARARRHDDDDGDGAALSAQEQVDCVRHALVELAFFVELYADLVALPEVLQRTSRLLEALPDAPLLPEACVPLAAAVAQALRDATLRVTQTRVPMAMQAKLAAKVTTRMQSRDILIRDPRADDPRERTRKLRKAVRREEKGAMRELRRDAFFMADERHQSLAGGARGDRQARARDSRHAGAPAGRDQHFGAHQEGQADRAPASARISMQPIEECTSRLLFVAEPFGVERVLVGTRHRDAAHLEQAGDARRQRRRRGGQRCRRRRRRPS